MTVLLDFFINKKKVNELMCPFKVKWSNAKLGNYEFLVYPALDKNSFNLSDYDTPKQVYAIILSKDRSKILAVKHKDIGYILPGGGIEQGEGLLDTLRRESQEEANVVIDLDKVYPFYYQEAYRIKGSRIFKGTQFRYLTIVKEIRQFSLDPDNDILSNIWIDISKIHTTLQWGNTSKWIQNVLQNLDLDKL